MGKTTSDERHNRLIADFLLRKALRLHNTEALVFVPVHNEQDTIAEVIAGVRKYCPFDILVIDDGSTDSTPHILEKLGVEVLRHPAPLGPERILNGLRIGLSLGYKYVIKIDSDGQHDPQDIKRLYEQAIKTEGDIVIGSRHVNKFHAKIWSVSGAGMWFCSKLVSLLSGKRITDTTSGLKLWSRKAAQTAIEAFQRGKLKNASTFHVEELIIAARKGLKVEEISVVMRPREFRETKSFAPKQMLLFPIRLVISTIRALL